MNIDFKIALIRRYGSQGGASRKLNIREAKISNLVHEYVKPNNREREILKQALGADYFEKQPPSAA